MKKTGIEIRDISKSGKTMTFTLILPLSPLPPLMNSNVPSTSPTNPEEKEEIVNIPNDEIDGEPESVFVNLPEFSVTFTFRENKLLNFAKLLTYTEQYLDGVFASSIDAQNILYLGIDLRISDWSFSIPSPVDMLDDSSLQSRQFTLKTSISTAVLFNGQLEVKDEPTPFQRDAITNALISSLSGEREWNDVNSFVAFLIAIHDTDISDIQSASVKLTQYGDPNRDHGTQPSKQGTNTAGLTMLVMTVVLFALGVALFVVRRFDLQMPTLRCGIVQRWKDAMSSDGFTVCVEILGPLALLVMSLFRGQLFAWFLSSSKSIEVDVNIFHSSNSELEDGQEVSVHGSDNHALLWRDELGLAISRPETEGSQNVNSYTSNE